MKYLALIVGLVLAPQLALAHVQVSDLKLHVASGEQEIETACKTTAPLGLYGCFFKGTNDLWVRSDIQDMEFFMTIFRHELGHFYLQNLTDWSYFALQAKPEQEALLPYLKSKGASEQEIDAQMWDLVEEPAANAFGGWALDHNSVSPELQKIFEQITK